MRSTRRSLTGVPVLAVVAATLLLPAAASADSSTAGDAATAAVSPAVSVVGPSIIGFESDPTGSKAEPFTSADNPTVHFLDSLGDDLNVADADIETNGGGLRVFGDDASELIIRLDVPTRRLSISFGNDDPGFSQAGDRATLKVFRFGKRLATESVVMNRNDQSDQTVTYTGKPIDRAETTSCAAATGSAATTPSMVAPAATPASSMSATPSTNARSSRSPCRGPSHR